MKWMKASEITVPGLYLFNYEGIDIKYSGLTEVYLDRRNNKLYNLSGNGRNRAYQEDWMQSFILCGPVPETTVKG